MLKLKIQCFGYLMQRADPDAETIEDRRQRARQRMRWLGGISDSMDMSSSNLRAIVKDREAWGTEVHGVAKSWT